MASLTGQKNPVINPVSMFLGLFWTKIKNQNLDMESYSRPLGLEYLASNVIIRDADPDPG